MGSRGTGSGVEPRRNSIRVQFRLDGKTERESLDLMPTPANVKFAEKLVENIRRAIGKGTFVYTEFFPESKRASKHDTKAIKTVRHFGELFYASKGAKAGHTKSQYRNALNFWYRQRLGTDVNGPLLGDTDVLDVGHADMAALVGSIPWASNKMANNTMIPLRGLFKLATKDMRKRGMENPVEEIESLKVQQKRPDPFTPEEVEQILDDLREHYDVQVVNYFEFQFRQGARPEETIALLWDDIDFPKRTATVERARSYRGQTKPCKTYSVRDLELSADTMEMLRRQRKHTQMKSHGHIFENPNTGRPWHDERSQRDEYWKPTFKRTKLRYRKPYQCRHTYATALLMNGANREYVSSQLGHKNSKLLHEVYSKWIAMADVSRERDKADAVWAKAKAADEKKKAA